MRLISLALVLLLGVLQLQLWRGAGGLPLMWRLQERVEIQRQENDYLEQRNSALAAEVLDLKEGVDAIEERARSELGMIQEDETFYQVIDRRPRDNSDDPS